MKKNKNGFMLVETLSVSVIVSTILIGLYVQFNNLVNNFNNDFTYNSVNNLYAAQNIKQLILNDSDFYKNLKLILNQHLLNTTSNETYFLEISTSCDATVKTTNADTAYALSASNCQKLETLTDFYGIKTILFIYSYAGLHETDTYSDYDRIESANLKKFIKSIKNSGSINVDENNNLVYDYQIILEFNNGEFANLKIYD